MSFPALKYQISISHPLLTSPAAQKYVLCQYNVARTKLVEATKITPGRRAPTINSLEETGWVAVSAMVEKRDVAGVMDRLTEVGATDIIILGITNTRV